MKHTIQLILGLCLAAIIIVAACKKSSNNTTGPTQSLNQLFSGLRTTPQNLSVQAGRDTIVYGAADSTMLHFYTNSFKDASGNAITSGIVNLQLIEMYKPSDMICNRTTTTMNDSLLTSGGEINITATMNGQKVFANKYGIGFKQSKASSTTMELYYGGNGNADSVITWAQGDNTKPGTVAAGTKRDSSTNASIYILYQFDSCNSFNWINCDCIFSYSSQHTPVSVVVPNNSFNPTNTQVYIAFPSVNGIIGFGYFGNRNENYSAATNTYTLPENSIGVPVGLPYDLVVITNNNGSYYFYETTGVTTAGGMTINAAMAPETPWDIVARMSAL